MLNRHFRDFIGLLEESQVTPLDRGNQYCPIQILVAPLARRFRREETGMTRGGVQRVTFVIGVMFRAQRVAGAEPHVVQRLVEMPLQRLRLSEGHQTAERPFAVGGGRVDQDARHLDLGIRGIRGVDSFPKRGRGVPALDGKLANQGVSERVEQDVPDAGVELLRRFQLPSGAPAK